MTALLVRGRAGLWRPENRTPSSSSVDDQSKHVSLVWIPCGWCHVSGCENIRKDTRERGDRDVYRQRNSAVEREVVNGEAQAIKLINSERHADKRPRFIPPRRRRASRERREEEEREREKGMGGETIKVAPINWRDWTIRIIGDRDPLFPSAISNFQAFD